MDEAKATRAVNPCMSDHDLMWHIGGKVHLEDLTPPTPCGTSGALGLLFIKISVLHVIGPCGAECSKPPGPSDDQAVLLTHGLNIWPAMLGDVASTIRVTSDRIIELHNHI